MTGRTRGRRGASLEIHPTTGAAQLVEVRELVREVTVERYVERESAPAAKPRLFEAESDEGLLSYGVPPEWLEEVRSATEDTVLELADHLPAEAAEALLELATGGRPAVAAAAVEAKDAFEHPDAQRRFRVVNTGGFIGLCYWPSRASRAEIGVTINSRLFEPWKRLAS
jgi:hypothetical protein